MLALIPYELLLTKSVLDGFMAVMLTTAMGIGVAFASLVILVYQGGLTLIGLLLQPLVSADLMADLSSVDVVTQRHDRDQPARPAATQDRQLPARASRVMAALIVCIPSVSCNGRRHAASGDWAFAAGSHGSDSSRSDP